MRMTTDAEWMFERYGRIRHRLPFATFPKKTRTIQNLSDVIDRFDTFVFDSFGVLNVGDAPVPGAADRIAGLRAAGKQVFVLTNAASVPTGELERKYNALGFDFSLSEIVSSRTVLSKSLDAFDAGMDWSVIAPDGADLGDLPARTTPYADSTADAGDGYIFLSSSGWTDARQDILCDALARRPRPLLIGNPDLAAPREAGLTVGPGAFAHDIADRLGLEPVFFGKPYRNAFDELGTRTDRPVDPTRTLMLGDTLHTDILGGKAAGLQTALVTGSGVMCGLDEDLCIAQSGIVPDFKLTAI